MKIPPHRPVKRPGANAQPEIEMKSDLFAFLPVRRDGRMSLKSPRYHDATETVLIACAVAGLLSVLITYTMSAATLYALLQWVVLVGLPVLIAYGVYRFYRRHDARQRKLAERK